LPAFTAVPEAEHAGQFCGNPPQPALKTHCMSALQPAVALHVFSAFVQSVHLAGLQEQRSKDPPSPGGGPASCGGVVVDDVDVDMDEVDVGRVEAIDVEAVVVPGPVVAVVNVVVDVAGVVWPVDEDGGLVVMVEAADVLTPRATPFAGSPPSAAHDVTPATSHAAHTNTRFRYMRRPAPSTSDVRAGESPGPLAR
jgi:hypothetical protein